MRTIRVGLCAAILVVMAGCGERQPDMSPVTVEIVGDSLLRLQERPLGGGASVVECTTQFMARVQGPEREHAVMQSGEIAYYWWQGGSTAAEYQWDQQAVTQLWGDSILAAGEDRISHPQGFGQQPPGMLVRAVVTFEYRTSNTEEVKRTEPFRFYCY